MKNIRLERRVRQHPVPDYLNAIRDNLPPRAERVRNVQGLLDHLDPLAVRYRDVLRMPDGDYTVCRVVSNRIGHDQERKHYICTNGARTAVIYEEGVTPLNHYRLGSLVSMLYRERRIGESIIFIDEACKWKHGSGKSRLHRSTPAQKHDTDSHE